MAVIDPTQLAAALSSAPGDGPIGIVLVDHGSKRTESNQLLLDLVELFKDLTRVPIVEPAHMELAEPSIVDAFDRVVAAGARRVIVAPYFLAPGRHMQEDIPRLAAEAAALHPGVSHTVAEPLGAHPQLVGVLAERVLTALSGSEG